MAFSDKLQSGCAVPSCQLRSHLQRGCDSLDRSMNAVGLLEIILLGSARAHLFPPCTKEKWLCFYYCPQQPHKYWRMGLTQHTFWLWPTSAVYPSSHWLRGRNEPRLGHPSLAGHTIHHSLKHLKILKKTSRKYKNRTKWPADHEGRDMNPDMQTQRCALLSCDTSALAGT